MPFTPQTIDESSMAIYEIYTSFIRAGFTEDQAMQITVAWIMKG